MPSRAPRSCPRCGGTYRGARCPVCTVRTLDRLSLRSMARDSKPREWNAYNTKAWRAFSRQFLLIHSTCECAMHMRQPITERPRSEITDHIDGLGPTGPRGYDPTNCQALTRKCHAIKTVKHDGGLGKPVNRMARK